MSASDDPWREYRKRRNLTLFVVLGYLPTIGLIALTTNALFNTSTPAFVLAPIWMVAAVVAGNWFIRFRCPRCGQPFFANSRWWGYNTFVRRCLHCKLPLHAASWDID